MDGRERNDLVIVLTYYAPQAARLVHVRFPPPPPPGRLVLEGKDLVVRYGDLQVFDGAHCQMEEKSVGILVSLLISHKILKMPQ